MKQFKHKNTNIVATQLACNSSLYTYTDSENKNIPFYIFENMLENSCDWKEIKEISVGTKVIDTNPDTKGYIYEKLPNGKWKLGSQDYFTIDEDSIGEGKRFKLFKEIIFTTEDGVELFEGEVYYCVNDSLILTTFFAYKDTIQQNVKTFAKRENAEKYIKNNKKQFSIYDVVNFVNNTHENRISPDDVANYFNLWY